MRARDPQIVAGIVARKKFVYLCTNALLLARHIDEYRPSPYLTFSIHLDGDRERHDESVCQEGVFDKAVAAIRLARSRGFRVTINCTLFSDEDPENAAQFFDTATGLGVEGITVSPGYSYQHAPRQDVFLAAPAASSCFARSSAADASARGAGAGRSITPRCSSISSPATSPTSARRGATRPTTSSAGSGRATCSPMRASAPTFRSLMEDTEWSRYGVGRNPACNNCMAHCGFEGTAVDDSFAHPLKALKVLLRGPRPMAPNAGLRRARRDAAGCLCANANRVAPPSIRSA